MLIYKNIKFQNHIKVVAGELIKSSGESSRRDIYILSLLEYT